MNGTESRTSLFFYVPVIFFAAFALFWVFNHFYDEGQVAGKNAPPPVEAVKKAAAVDLRALGRDESLAAKGRPLFGINCASCHGPKGYGDGDRAASLNPKPRNYHTEKFKFGDDIFSIYSTLLKGSPGTSMPSFALLPPEDVMAMAHYVRALIPKPTPTTDAIINQFPDVGGTGGGATASATLPGDTTKAGPRIPIQLAMKSLETVYPTTTVAAGRVDRTAAGAELFSQQCARCHGATGDGVTWRTLAVAPYRYAATGSLKQPDAGWKSDRKRFAEVITHGLPGDLMPGYGTLTTQQVDDLHTYVKNLAAR
ncbi:c-type cytochrome [candidate division KSB1 bacterium]|nr:c-type cytochrome [candidate division KSB1 bacterium]